MSTNTSQAWRVCRICLRQPELEMQGIFDLGANTDAELVNKIKTCGGIPISRCDGFPQRICCECILSLEIAYKFRNTCQDSNQRLCSFRYTLNDQPNQTECLGYDSQTINEELIDFDPMDVVAEELQEITRENENTEHEGPQIKIEEDVFENPEIAVESGKNANKKVKSQKTKHKQRTDEERKSGSAALKKDPDFMIKTETTFICYVCGNIYINKYKLNEHLKTHNSVKLHECEICHKRFATSPQLSRHMNSHTGNRPYKCKTCTASFSDPSTCIKHQRIHTNERPYPCEECGKAFVYSHNLKVHMMIHTGEKPFSCEICGKGFSQRHHKKTHVRTHSNSNRRTSKPIKQPL